MADVDPGLVVSYCNNISVTKNLLFANSATDYLSCVGIDNCEGISFFNNTISGNSSPNPNFGSVTFNHCNNFVITNNIISFNSDWGLQKLGNTYNYIVTYNNVYANNSGNYIGFSPGPGCISLDPLFVGGDPFDYHLQAGSPCIDAGDPNSPLDPDGSIADMGALYSGEIVTNFGFDIGDTYGENGQPVSIPISAFGLGDQDISGLEFHFSFDNLCLQYDTVLSAFFGDMLINVVDDEIHILWEDYANPVFLPDSGEGFELQFTVLGQLGDTCAIGWFGNNEIVDSIGNIISGIEYADGSVRVIEFHSINGRVIYYDMVTPLEDVDLMLSGDWTSTETTDQNGFYEFQNLFPGDFVICPEREDDDPGVTVSDVVKIRRHLVLLEPFDTPYKFIAADVNQNEFVSVADVIKIRRYLAGLEPLPSGNWSFVDSSYAITDENWMDAPDCIEFSIWDADLADSNFIGVRMGDVDVTLGINSGTPPVVTDNVMLDLIDSQGSPGDTVEISLLVQGFVDVAGIEIHLEYPGGNIDFIELNSGVISDYTLNSPAGEIHLVWEDIENPVTLPTNSELFSISFEILPGTTEDVPVGFTTAYVVNSFGTDFAVYSSDALINLIPLSIEDSFLLPDKMNVHQNYPNPFNARTLIKFDLPVSSRVKIEIFDLLGRKIETLLDGRFEAGYHDVSWNAENYPSGLYFYIMQAEDYSKACKMLLLK
jgi:hypothetical protein